MMKVNIDCTGIIPLNPPHNPLRSGACIDCISLWLFGHLPYGKYQDTVCVKCFRSTDAEAVNPIWGVGVLVKLTET